MNWWSPAGERLGQAVAQHLVEHPDAALVGDVDREVEPELLLRHVEVHHDLERVVAQQRRARLGSRGSRPRTERSCTGPLPARAAPSASWL